MPDFSLQSVGSVGSIFGEGVGDYSGSDVVAGPTSSNGVTSFFKNVLENTVAAGAAVGLQALAKNSIGSAYTPSAYQLSQTPGSPAATYGPNNSYVPVNRKTGVFSLGVSGKTLAIAGAVGIGLIALIVVAVRS